jgi:hypothetical protein
MRKIFYLLLVLNTASIAQPRIDSIAIDEDAGELQLFGDFQLMGELQVTCDSVPLRVVLRAQDMIRDEIPDSGKGSCGWVSVRLFGEESNRKLITYWHFHNFYMDVVSASDGGVEFESKADTIFLRGDALSAYNAYRGLRVKPVKFSTIHEVAYGRDGEHGFEYHGPTYDTIRRADLTFQVNFKGSDIGIHDPYLSWPLRFDNSGELIPYKDYISGNTGTGRWGGPLSNTRFPLQTLSVKRLPESARCIELISQQDNRLLVGSKAPGILDVYSITGSRMISYPCEVGENILDLTGVAQGFYLLSLRSCEGRSIKLSLQ